MTPSRYVLILPVLFVALFFGASNLLAASSTEIKSAFEQMQSPSIGGGDAIHLDDQVIEFKDFILEIDSGTFYGFSPLTLGGQSVSYGGMFVGRARISFKPSTTGIEQGQLRRFMGVDSLSVPIREVELFLDRGTLDRLSESVSVISPHVERVQTSLDEHHQFLRSTLGQNMLWSVLKGIASEGEPSFLLANSALGKFGQTIYVYDPFRAEEVSLWINPWELVVERTLRLVCSYSEFSTGKASTINGLNKDQLSNCHYDLVTQINSKTEVTVTASLNCLVEKPFQIIHLVGPARMNLDSVIHGDASAEIVTITDSAAERSDLWLILDEFTTAGDSLRLDFYYRPDLPSRLSTGYLQLDAANWFPVYAGQQSSFEMEFRTPRLQTLVVSARMMTRQMNGNELITTWSQELPVRRVAFSLGLNRSYDLTDERGAPVSLAYNPRLIAEPNYTFGREQSMTEEFSNAMSLLSHNFGPYQFASLKASPMPELVSQTYPSLIGINSREIGQTEEFVADPFKLSSQVAAQWWGLVDHSTYHDSWLTHGMVRYSAYMYLQATRGNQAIFERLEADQKRIFATCQAFPSPNEECGPIALGNRTAGHSLSDESDLVIYQRGAWLFHMLRNLLLDLNSMSDELFLNMMREWYRTNKAGFVSTAQFIQLTEKYIGADMDWFFDQFVYNTPLPTYYFSYELGQYEDGRTQVICKVRQEGVPESFKMYLPVEVEFITGQRFYLRLLIDQPAGEIELPPLEGRVKSVRLNPFHSVLCRVVTD